MRILSDDLFVVMRKGNSETQAQRAERLVLQAQRNALADAQQNERYHMDGILASVNQAVSSAKEGLKSSASTRKPPPQPVFRCKFHDGLYQNKVRPITLSSDWKRAIST